MVSKNPLLQDEFNSIIRQLLTNIEPKLGEINELDARLKYVGVCALFSLHFQLYRTDDKKLGKSIWDVYKKVRHSSRIMIESFVFFKIPIIHLSGNVSWTPCRFLMERIPTLARLLEKKALQTAEQQRLIYLQTKESTLIK